MVFPGERCQDGDAGAPRSRALEADQPRAKQEQKHLGIYKGCIRNIMDMRYIFFNGMCYGILLGWHYDDTMGFEYGFYLQVVLPSSTLW